MQSRLRMNRQYDYVMLSLGLWTAGMEDVYTARMKSRSNG